MRLTVYTTVLLQVIVSLILLQTDTASVLLEAITYIKFMQEQVVVNI